ncbi:MAG: hypothetical protein ACRCUS_00605, partial [Anaerovoracaceae bacterium]
MIELDGISYALQTPEENTQELITYVNSYCSNNNIKNTKGSIIFVETNIANPLYLLFWACGYLASKLQKLLYNIGCLTSLVASSERQFLNLCDIARLQRQQQTKTSIKAIVYSDPESASPCVISTADKITVLLSGQT